uniref:Uncharacterized protein LOC104240318 n=1 Tax=Nicotiana sylvestris TaxID=4096 RepID=A0A1U7Y2I4_NICSY|nr:PREDICTED: uncharacterized protein LOC104240318 [Nicotiana sylvestris]
MYPAWQSAMTQEFEALYANNTWDLVPLPNGKHTISCRWVYKVKHKADGIERYKARLVVKGYTQQARIDYTETFSPLVKMTIVRSLIAIAAKKRWQIYQLDVNNIFLHGDLPEEVYMKAPPGLELKSPNLVCKLNKSLYGLKQAVNSGLEVLYKEDGIIISQRKFVLDLLKEYDCLHSTNLTSPLDPTMKLKAKEGSPLFDPIFYRRLVGKLNFLINTRLDIPYEVQHLSQFMQDPKEPHLHAAYHMLRYLKKDPTLGLYFSNASSLSITAYCDSDWAAYPDSGGLCLVTLSF